MVRALARCLGRRYAWVGLWTVVEAAFQVAEPVFLGLIIDYFEAESTTPARTGFLYAIGLILVTLMHAIMHHVVFFGGMRTGMQMRTAAVGLVYRKALRLSQKSLGATTTGKVVNLVSSDVQRFDQTTPFLHFVWVGPIQVRARALPG